MFIKVKAHPGEKRPKLTKKSADSFEIWVKEPAERGLANDAVRSALAQALGLPVGKLRLIKGATSPSKIFEVLP